MTESNLHQVAAYIYANAVLNTEYGTYSIDIDELEDIIETTITREDYNALIDTMYNDYQNQILDINNGEDDYHFDELRDIDINIGTWYYFNDEE